MAARERETLEQPLRDVRLGLGSTGKPYVSLGNGLSAAQELSSFPRPARDQIDWLATEHLCNKSDTTAGGASAK